MRASDLGDRDALLAVATTDRAYAFQVPVDRYVQQRSEALQRDVIEPALRRKIWPALPSPPPKGCPPRPRVRDVVVRHPHRPGRPCPAVFVLWLWARRRRSRRRQAEFAAARRVDPADPSALSAVPIDALDDLSKAIVVDVDNAVRTSESELALAVEEFGAAHTDPFTRASAIRARRWRRRSTCARSLTTPSRSRRSSVATC